jgi:hypothetical protein
LGHAGLGPHGFSAGGISPRAGFALTFLISNPSRSLQNGKADGLRDFIPNLFCGETVFPIQARNNKLSEYGF